MVGDLDYLLKQDTPPDHAYSWATVVSVSPLTIILDEDIVPLDLVPVDLAGRLTVGKRVLTLLLGAAGTQGRRAIILGPGGEKPDPPPFVFPTENVPKMYTYTGEASGNYSLPHAQYHWLGPMTPSPVYTASNGVNPPSMPTEFSYSTVAEVTYGTALRANVAGLFRVTAYVRFNNNTTGSRYLRAKKDGSELARTSITGQSGIQTVRWLTATAYLAPGQRLGMQIYQNSGSALTVPPQRTFTMEYLGPLP